MSEPPTRPIVAVAATDSPLDRELAQQLSALAADEHFGPDSGKHLSSALLEAGGWILAALCAWLALAWYG